MGCSGITASRPLWRLRVSPLQSATLPLFISFPLSFFASTHVCFDVSCWREHMSLPSPSQDAPATAGHPSFFMHRAFAFLWLGQTISEFGSMITGSALQLLAVLVLGASSAQMGLLAFFSSLPILAFGLLTG